MDTTAVNRYFILDYREARVSLQDKTMSLMGVFLIFAPDSKCMMGCTNLLHFFESGF